jgi:hypothetical protein
VINPVDILEDKEQGLPGGQRGQEGQEALQGYSVFGEGLQIKPKTS